MQKVAGKEGLWRLEPHEKLLGVRCKVLRDAVPALADGTVFSGAFGVVGGRVMRPKPKSGGMYLVHLEGDSPSDQAMRIVAYLDRYGRVFACDEPQVAPPARTPDMEIARFNDVAQDAVKTAGYVYVHDGEGDAARCVAAYKGTADLYKVSDTWYRFGERKAMTYKEFMARAYFALCFRPAMGAPAVPSRGVMGVLDALGPEKPFEALRELAAQVQRALSDPQLEAPGAVRLLLENLEQAGLFAIHERGVSDEAVRLVRSTKYAHLAYLVRNQEDAGISDQELWGIEAALNRFILLCERMGDRADAAGLDECRQADAQLFVAVGEQDLAGGMPDGAPSGHEGGEWGVRCRLALAIEQLRLPVRVDVELAGDIGAGQAAFCLTMPPEGMVPGAAGGEQGAALPYVMRVGLLLADHAFATEPGIAQVKLMAFPLPDPQAPQDAPAAGSQQPVPAVLGAPAASEQLRDSRETALFEVDLDRALYAERGGFKQAIAGDPRELLDAAGARYDVADAQVPRQRVMHPVFESWSADDQAGELPTWAQGPLGAKCERDLDIEYDTAYRRMAEGLADSLVEAQSATEAIAAVRRVQSAALEAKDERAVSACTRLMAALAEGSIDAADQNAVVGRFLGEDRCLVALGRAHSLAETDPAAAVEALIGAIAEAQLLDGFADGSQEAYRAFDSYSARVLYNVSRATQPVPIDGNPVDSGQGPAVDPTSGSVAVPDAVADAGKRVRVVPDSFYLCHLEVTHLLERSFERADEALRYGRAAVAMGPSCAMGYRVLGRAYMLQGDMGRAFDVLRAGLRVSLQPTDIALMYYQLGYVMWKRGSADAGVACYLKAVEASPSIAMQATAELRELVAETGASIPPAGGVEAALATEGVPCAPASETLDVIDAALSAACDAGLANVARSLLATRLRHRPDDALMGVLRSFGEPA